MINVETKVKKAEIYFQGASVTRWGSTYLEAGGNRICITGLAKNIERESLTLYIPGCRMQGPITIEQRQTKQDEENKKEYVSREKKLKEEIAEVDIQLSTAEDLCNIYKSGSQIGSVSSVQGGEYFDMLKSIAEQFAVEREKYNVLSSKKRSLQKQLEELQEENGKLYVPKETVAIAAVTVETAGRYDVYIEYRDRSVSWTPMYDILVPSVKERIRLCLNAMIRQQTEEDWEDVELVLHTGSPGMRLTIPKLQPWMITEKVLTPPVSRSVSTGIPRYGLFSDDETTLIGVEKSDRVRSAPRSKSVDSLPVPDKAAMLAQQVLSGGAEANALTTEYKIKGNWTIPANEYLNEGTIVKIDEFTLEGEYNYSCVPKLSEKIYLTAFVRNFPVDKMPAGTASIYFENRYMGQIKLDPTTMMKGLTLPLGVDRSLKASRKRRNEENYKGFMSGKKRKSFEYDITIESVNDKAVNVVVHDQIPITDRSQITIDAGSYPEAATHTEDGELTWNITVPAREKVNILLNIIVTYPQNMVITI